MSVHETPFYKKAGDYEQEAFLTECRSLIWGDDRVRSAMTGQWTNPEEPLKGEEPSETWITYKKRLSRLRALVPDKHDDTFRMREDFGWTEVEMIELSDILRAGASEMDRFADQLTAPFDAFRPSIRELADRLRYIIHELPWPPDQRQLSSAPPPGVTD